MLINDVTECGCVVCTYSNSIALWLSSISDESTRYAMHGPRPPLPCISSCIVMAGCVHTKHRTCIRPQCLSDVAKDTLKSQDVRMTLVQGVYDIIIIVEKLNFIRGGGVVLQLKL